jgi:Ca2+-binding RTX toxin-like protein
MVNVVGSENVDVLAGTADEDTMSALAGNDRLIGSLGEDRLDGGDGDDTADYRDSEGAINVSLALEHQATSTAGPSYSSGDTLISIENVMGSAYDDYLSGNEKNNVFTGGAGADRIFDGSGAYEPYHDHDRASYKTSAEAVDVDLRRTEQQFGGDAEGDRLQGIENLSGSAFDDRLIGDAGNNVLNGGDGADFLDGASGTEDIAEYTGSKAGIDVDLNRILQHGGAAEGDQLVGFEGVYGTRFDDQIVGDAGDNFLTGNGGNDTIVGGGGFDCINAGDGDDTVEISSLSKPSGGEGFDKLIVDVTKYDLYETYSDGFYTAYNGNDKNILLSTFDYPYDSPSQMKLATGFERLEFLGSKHDDFALGTDSADKLVGNDGDDYLVGGGGGDHVDGGTGNDTLFAGVQFLASDVPDGSDELFGGSGDDTLNAGTVFGFIDGGDGTDMLRLSITTYDGDGFIDVRTTGRQGQHIANIERFELYGGQGNDVLISGRKVDLLEGGDGNDLLRAGYNNDTLHGGAENDELYGEDGNDELTGGTGDDVLTGGAGADSFIFRSAAGQGHDVVTDFNVAEGDTLSFRHGPTSPIHSFDDFMHAATQTENGVLIDLDGDGSSSSSILIANATVEDFSPENVYT